VPCAGVFWANRKINPMLADRMDAAIVLRSLFSFSWLPPCSLYSQFDCKSSEIDRVEASIISASEEVKNDQMPAPKVGILYKISCHETDYDL